LKEEVLNNKFASISKACWNDTLTKCESIYRCKVQCVKIKQWCQQLKENNIGMKELIALKLYCDYDNLQREFRKCFLSPYNQNKNRLSSFYWWNITLSKAFEKFNKIKYAKRYDLLFHGVSSIMNIDSIKGKYFGPLSTSTDISVARSFAGKYGMILVIEPNYDDQQNNGYKPFDISYLSEFPDECEILCYDQSYTIKKVILSAEYDRNGKLHELYKCNQMIKRVHKLSESTESIIEYVEPVIDDDTDNDDTDNESTKSASEQIQNLQMF